MAGRGGLFHLKVWQLILIDLAAIGVSYWLFALAHHIVPIEGGPALMQTAALAGDPARSGEENPGIGPNGDPSDPNGGEEGPTPDLPKPPAYYGDFSATFPAAPEEGFEGALRWYRDDDIQIVIRAEAISNFVYYAADVWVRDLSYLRAAFARDTYGRGYLESVEGMAARNDALLAVSGDYYGAHGNGIVIRNGLLYRETQIANFCVINQDGAMKIYGRNEADLEAVYADRPYQAWSFGPWLLKDGARVVLDDHSLNRTNPRCAIGYYEPGHYVFVIVDGRQPGYSDGITLTGLSRLMESLGCAEAYNLDGGQTAVMVFQGEVINRPVDGGRPLSDIVYIRR